MNRTHGMRDTPEYATWRAIKKRCYVKTCASYRYYGGVGVTMSGRWYNSFATFYRDVGPRPTPDHSIDRWPDPHGNYEPGNVRWATDSEQNRNRRTYNVYVIFEGQRRTVIEWAELTGLSAMALYWRLKNGWTVRRTLTERVFYGRRPRK